MENQKKEINISKSFIKKMFNNLLYSIFFAFITLLLIQHFGEIFIEKITSYDIYNAYGEKVGYNSPLHAYLFYPNMPKLYYAQHPNGYNIEDIEYFTKVFKIYIPDLLENCRMKLFMLTIVYYVVLFAISKFKSKFSIKLNN